MGNCADKEPKTLDLVIDYHFIVRDDDNTYHVRYVSTDSQKKFSHLFLWEMEFKPGEKKTLHVAYQLPMSMALSEALSDEAREADEREMQRHMVPLDKKGEPQSEPPSQPNTPKDAQPPLDEKKQEALVREGFMFAAMQGCLVEWFQYVTETGSSWAGPIEKATFRVQTDGLAFCLAQRAVLRAGDAMRKGVVYQKFSPEGGKYDPKTGTTTWEYKNYKPGKLFRFTYCALPLPTNVADCDGWVRIYAGDEPTKTIVQEMREVVAAFYGIAPHTKSVKEFVERQVWYHPKKDLQESKLPVEQRAVLDRLDAIAKGLK